jgi:hypothetical protein
VTASRSLNPYPELFAAGADERAANRENITMQNMSKKPSVRVLIDDQTLPITFMGRDAWALDNLMRAGERGCTPIDTPGPRWSHYVFKLRRAGVNVETIDEGHGGAFAGSHARYVLRSRVRIVQHYGAAA